MHDVYNGIIFFFAKILLDIVFIECDLIIAIQIISIIHQTSSLSSIVKN